MAELSSLNSDVWVLLAEQHGIEFAQVGPAPGVVALTGASFETTDYAVHIVSTLHPSRVRRYTGLVITQAATTAALEAATGAGLSVLVASRHGVHGHLINHAGALRALPLPPPAVTRTHRRGPTPWGAVAVCIELLDHQPCSQVQLARATELSQPRVSQLLRTLRWARRGSDGWVIADIGAALKWLTDVYRAPALTSSWLTLEAPVPATLAVARELERSGARYAVVGPVAADLLAPWETPQHTVVWTDRLIDLTAAGCVPAPTDQATVTLAVADDPRALRGLDRGELHVAHPWRVWVSLSLDGHTQAADHLREKLTPSGAPGGALT